MAMLKLVVMIIVDHRCTALRRQDHHHHGNVEVSGHGDHR